MGVTLKGYIVVPAGELDVIKKHLDVHIIETRNEEGCVTFEVIQRENNPLVFDVYEKFKDHNAFLFHQKRTKNSAWGRVTQNVERHYQITDTHQA